MGDIGKNIRNVTGFNVPLVSSDTNAPEYYKKRKKQYMAAETLAFNREMLHIASDFFEAEAQGLNYEDFYEWRPVMVRLADVVSPTSLTQVVEDYKLAEFEDSSIDYFGIGAYLKTLGSTYINVNPANVSSTSTTALVRRCDAVWHMLDYYGNVLEIPFVWDKPGALGTQRSFADYTALMNAYQHCIMQYSPATAWVSENSRVILGDQAYEVRGLQNFSREFTDDPESVHIMRFDLTRTEPNVNDDMVNMVADGLAFSWNIDISGSQRMTAGTQQTLTITSTRNGQVLDQEKHDFSYFFISSNALAAQVDEKGAVTAKAEGNTVITCRLQENPNISATFSIEVAPAQETPYVAFIENAPARIGQLKSFTVRAALFESGEQQTAPVTYSVSGPPRGAYTASEADGALNVTCYAPSQTPLTITASAEGVSASQQTILEGI